LLRDARGIARRLGTGDKLVVDMPAGSARRGGASATKEDSQQKSK